MNHIFSIEDTTKLNENEEKQVSQINFENLDKNGGQLHYEGILPHEYAVLVKHNEQVVGYALLKESFYRCNDIYVMQVAVDKKYQHCGIGSAMYDYIYRHANGYKFITANVSLNNEVSQNFHLKNNFKYFGTNNLGLIYVKPVKKKIKLSLGINDKEYIKKHLKNDLEM